jgi:hypothetical protein
MWIQTFFKSLNSTPSRRRPIRRCPPAGRLSVEQLEDRTVPANFTASYGGDLIADINAANQIGGSNTITLVLVPDSSFALYGVDNTTDGATGLPVIATNDNLTIIGNSNGIFRTGTPNYRLFDVASGAALTLENLTLQGGCAYGSGISACGGAIYSQGSLTLDGVTVQGNAAAGSGGINDGVGSDGRGGGLYVAGGTVTITNSNLSANQASGGYGGGGGGSGPIGFNAGKGGTGLGGAMYVAAGTVIMTNDTMSANTAQGGQGGGGGAGETDGEYSFDSYGGAGGAGGTGHGGAVYVAAGSVVMTNATMSANTAQGGRGGDGGPGYDFYGLPPYFGGHGGNAGNGSSGLGGGVYVAGGTVTLKSSSATSNSALAGTGGLGGFGDVTSGTNGIPGLGQGGGLYIAALTAVDLDAFTIQHVVNNTASTSYPDIFGFGISFAISGFPSTTTAGTAGSFTVTAKNADGTTATGYTGTVHFSSSDGQAVLPADYTFTAADGGVHTFSATLKTAGTQSITATDTATGSIAGSETGITVIPAAASTMSVSGFPSPITAGVAGSFTITLNDPYGNIASGYAGTVHFTSSDGKASLPANYTFTAADAGVHTFSATLKTADTQSITAMDTTIASLTGTDSGISVNPAAAAKFVLSAPATVTHGITFSLTMTVIDAYGNVVTNYSGTVHFTSTDGTASLPANYTFTAADKGVHTFSGLVLRKRGNQKITITDTLNSSLTGSVIENVI